jgi:3-oxoacyl-[acyl-carrier-protein] synthase II
VIRFVDSMNRDNDVVVTGIGMVTPLGGSTSDTWQRLIAGDTAGRPLQHHEIDAFEALTVLLGHPPGGAPATQRLSDAWSGSIARPSPLPAQLLQAWRSEPYVSLLLDALFEAARDAKLELPVASPLRTGCVIGASKGGLRTLEKLAAPHSSSGKSLLETSSHENPFLWDNAAHPDAALRAATVTTGAEAFQTCPVAACATGLISILQAACRIVAGECDICFAGSSDAALRATVVSAYHRLRVTSRSAHPATACRPFDRSRDGFIIGEGAAVVVLESRRHAHSRGVSPIARLTAGGWLNDTSGMAQIDTAGTCVTELIHRVMAALPDEGRVDWINNSGGTA